MITIGWISLIFLTTTMTINKKIKGYQERVKIYYNQSMNKKNNQISKGRNKCTLATSQNVFPWKTRLVNSTSTK